MGLINSAGDSRRRVLTSNIELVKADGTVLDDVHKALSVVVPGDSHTISIPIDPETLPLTVQESVGFRMADIRSCKDGVCIHVNTIDTEWEHFRVENKRWEDITIDLSVDR